MSENQPVAGAPNPGASNSLLEDASTLLMFHNAAITNESPPLPKQTLPQESKEAPSLPKSSTTSLLPSHTVKPTPIAPNSSRPSSTPNPTAIRSPRINNLASPGPAIAALADSDNEGEPDKSQKAMVAAAALAAAAGVPLPLINHNDQNSLNQQIIEKLKEKGSKSSDEILKNAQKQVSKEQLGALQERAEIIRQELQNDNKVNDEKATTPDQIPLKQDDETSVESDISKHDANETDVESKDNDDTTIIKEHTSTDDTQYNNETEEEQPLPSKEESKPTSKQPESSTEHEADNEPKPKRQRKQAKKKPRTESFSVPKDRIVDPDSGLITCVCSFEDDDGFTIQCDNCYRWQHAVCMGISSMDNVPDDYLCNVCSPRKIDVKKAKALQTQRLNSIRRRKERRSRNSEGDGSNNNNNNNVGGNDPKEGSGQDSSDDKLKNEQSNQSNKPTRPKPKQNAYGKNLEDDDIQVLDVKDAYQTIYFALNDYDYQDESIYNFTDNLKKLDNPLFYQISQKEYESTNFPQLNIKPYSEINNKKFNGLSRLGLFTESTISIGDLIGEYLGEIGNKDKYITDSRNHYRIWGVEKPQVQFIPGFPLVIDARNSGNLTRFIRRSCNANCELQTVIISKEKVKFVLRAIKLIKPGAELTLNWNWDVNHPIKSIEEGRPFDQTSDAVKPSLVLSVESILSFTECGCTQVNECSLSKVKKASAHIYRATRKGNNTSGLKLLQKEAQYSSIQSRLIARETSNMRDSYAQVKSSIPTGSNRQSDPTEEEDIGIRPYIYKYFSKKRRLGDPSNPQTQPQLPPQTQQEKQQFQYLPIPIELITQDVKPNVNNIISPTTINKEPPQPKKKLSFADYVKKKKPT
ncbi:SET domain-containing protein 3 [Wickerhamomyces ciferrii]|uniref:SET domain-containing protein 3 n=1 Tax=Wickerhamomyces ciferrii (strain ATCC 14091 / BCRC 22168 / CBS 111 / JCM 3599 / NBRC 0793 / NRRL Y-1031 F-60-10) TaxID=1206466 RepID=K0KWN8_WICCF|nr:SET domain-containing protein 3 [Wickerhamomyces ciferrii]CCH45538.1 SET domain-containing protein 3 [Wickerhamomyces ciferrii]